MSTRSILLHSKYYNKIDFTLFSIFSFHNNIRLWKKEYWNQQYKMFQNKGDNKNSILFS